MLLGFSFVGTTWVFWASEHGINPRIKGLDDVAWWWFVSSTTVGYGDIAPITGMGRAAGVVVIIIGIYCYTNFIALTADSLHGLTNQRRLGTAQIRAQGHVVICEYTAFADELVQALPRYPELARREVVIVSDLVKVQPYPRHHFVRGVPISPSALKQAAVQQADIVFVFANARFADPDLKTLHTVSRIRQLAPQARILVELNNPQHELASHLGDRTFILASKELLASVLRDGSIDLSAHFSTAVTG
ncbi:MAG: NAD-binding protein [Opitutae bacterium]|nr:NAD-binding protein [Opitutae bacterium]